MDESTLYRYDPDYAVAPGEVLEETLEARRIKKADLAERCGLSPKTVSLILGGKAPISAETALCLQRVLGVPANIWTNLEANYRLFLARETARDEMAGCETWARRFPVNELSTRGFLEGADDPARLAGQLLDFFAVGSVDAWETKFGKLEVSFRCSASFKSSREAVAAWLRIGEICADKIHCAPFNRSRFLQALAELRKLTARPPNVFEPEMRRLCAEAGVALAIVAELPGTHLSGAARWLAKDRALIMLSIRHKKDDHFWFSFFHEAGHVLLGGKKAVFLDEIDSSSGADEEQANQFASDILIPRRNYDAFLRQGPVTTASVQTLAKQIGIAPGIVVGRLQHEGILPWSSLNRLKRKVDLVEACG